MELSLMELMEIKLSLVNRMDYLNDRRQKVGGSYGTEEIRRLNKIYYKVDEEFRKKAPSKKLY